MPGTSRDWQTIRRAYRLCPGHAPRGLVQTTGTAGGYDSAFRAGAAKKAGRTARTVVYWTGRRDAWNGGAEHGTGI